MSSTAVAVQPLREKQQPVEVLVSHNKAKVELNDISRGRVVSTSGDFLQSRSQVSDDRRKFDEPVTLRQSASSITTVASSALFYLLR